MHLQMEERLHFTSPLSVPDLTSPSTQGFQIKRKDFCSIPGSNDIDRSWVSSFAGETGFCYVLYIWSVPHAFPPLSLPFYTHTYANRLQLLIGSIESWLGDLPKKCFKRSWFNIVISAMKSPSFGSLSITFLHLFIPPILWPWWLSSKWQLTLLPKR